MHITSTQVPVAKGSQLAGEAIWPPSVYPDRKLSDYEQPYTMAPQWAVLFTTENFLLWGPTGMDGVEPEFNARFQRPSCHLENTLSVTKSSLFQ